MNEVTYPPLPEELSPSKKRFAKATETILLAQHISPSFLKKWWMVSADWRSAKSDEATIPAYSMGNIELKPKRTTYYTKKINSNGSFTKDHTRLTKLDQIILLYLNKQNEFCKAAYIESKSIKDYQTSRNINALIKKLAVTKLKRFILVISIVLFSLVALTGFGLLFESAALGIFGALLTSLGIGKYLLFLASLANLILPTLPSIIPLVALASSALLVMGLLRELTNNGSYLKLFSWQSDKVIIAYKLSLMETILLTFYPLTDISNAIKKFRPEHPPFKRAFNLALLFFSPGILLFSFFYSLFVYYDQSGLRHISFNPTKTTLKLLTLIEDVWCAIIDAIDWRATKNDKGSIIAQFLKNIICFPMGLVKHTLENIDKLIAQPLITVLFKLPLNIIGVFSATYAVILNFVNEPLHSALCKLGASIHHQYKDAKNDSQKAFYAILLLAAWHILNFDRALVRSITSFSLLFTPTRYANICKQLLWRVKLNQVYKKDDITLNYEKVKKIFKVSWKIPFEYYTFENFARAFKIKNTTQKLLFSWKTSPEKDGLWYTLNSNSETTQANQNIQSLETMIIESQSYLRSAYNRLSRQLQIGETEEERTEALQPKTTSNSPTATLIKTRKAHKKKISILIHPNEMQKTKSTARIITREHSIVVKPT